MKLRISTLPPTGLVINEELPLEPLNVRMREGRDQSIQFNHAPKVNIKVFPKAGGAELTGTIISQISQSCARCVQALDNEIKVDLHYILKPRPADGTAVENDIGLIYYDDDVVELENDLQESIILQVELYWSPPLDEDTKCTVCGRHAREFRYSDDSEKKSLGQLLKKAGVS